MTRDEKRIEAVKAAITEERSELKPKKRMRDRSLPRELLNAFDDAREAMHTAREVLDSMGKDLRNIDIALSDLYECETHIRDAGDE